jgi:TolA-binding protein
MASSKLETLLKKFTFQELQLVKKSMSEELSGRSLLLFEELSESEEMISDSVEFRNSVFRKLFKEEYSKAKDYLLRNECRLLMSKLREATVTAFCSNELAELAQESGVFADWLEQKGLVELAEEELLDLLTKHKKTSDIKGQLRVIDQLSNLRIHYVSQSEQNCEIQIAESKVRIELIKKHAAEEIRKEEIRLKHAERVLITYKKDYAPLPFESTINIDEIEQESERAKYYRLRARANVAMDDSKTELMMELISNPERIKRMEANPKEALCRMLIGLALSHYLKGRYSQAGQYFGEAYLNVNEVNGPVREVLIYDYAFCLIKEGDFENAKKIAEKHHKELSNSKILGRKSSLIFIIIHLFFGDVKTASKFIDFENKQESPEYHYSMRLAISAIQYRKGEIEEAIRECLNVDQALNYMLRKNENAQIRQIKECSIAFLKFFRLQAEVSDKKTHRKGLTKIIDELEEVTTIDGSASAYGSVHSIWLVHEAKRLSEA